jgi:hypothetical protein
MQREALGGAIAKTGQLLQEPLDFLERGSQERKQVEGGGTKASDA